MTTCPVQPARPSTSRSELLVVCVFVERLLGSLDAGCEVAGGERCACHQVAGARGRGVRRHGVPPSSHASSSSAGCASSARAASRSCKRRCRLGFAQAPVGFRLELGSGDQIDPVGVQRIAGVTVADARRAENAAETAHEHRELRGWIARLIVEPEDVGEPLHR